MSKYDYNVLNISLAAGLSDFEVVLEGERIIFLTGTQTLSIKLEDRSQDQIPLKPKASITNPFTRFFVSADAYAETIQLLVAKPASFNVETREVNVDSLQTIVDPVTITGIDLDELQYWYNSLTLKNVFTGRFQANAVTAKYGVVQIFNPVDSGKILQIRTAILDSSSGAPGYIRRYDTELTGYPQNNVPNIVKLNSAGADSAAHIWGGTESDSIGSLYLAQIYFQGPSSTYARNKWEPENPVILNEGEGIIFASTTPNYEISPYIEWEEV